MMDHDLDRLEPEDESLMNLLSSYFGREDNPRLLLSDETVDVLEAQCTALPLPASLKTRLARVARQAEADREFEAALEKRRQRATLGTYLAFLRGKAGWTVSETAKRLRLEFQWLADLERDALSPPQIPARRLADLLKRLKGSLEMTERLLFSTIQTSRFVGSMERDSLYRRGSASSQGRWAEPPDPPGKENPEYLDQVEAVTQLREQLRAAWGA